MIPLRTGAVVVYRRIISQHSPTKDETPGSLAARGNRDSESSAKKTIATENRTGYSSAIGLAVSEPGKNDCSRDGNHAQDFRWRKSLPDEIRGLFRAFGRVDASDPTSTNSWKVAP